MGRKDGKKGGGKRGREETGGKKEWQEGRKREGMKEWRKGRNDYLADGPLITLGDVGHALLLGNSLPGHDLCVPGVKQSLPITCEMLLSDTKMNGGLEIFTIFAYLKFKKMNRCYHLYTNNSEAKLTQGRRSTMITTSK